ncbi:cell surface SD repeat-containing protein [Streptococcus sanguinis OH0843]|nr:cell surface SD repeat-containing protein [Streptococcus sanguinis OH0843]
MSNGSGSWSSIGDASSSKDNSDFSSFGDAISSGNNYSSGSWSSISDSNTSSADLSTGNWTSTNDSAAKKSSEISDSFSDFDTGDWSRTSDALADNASSTSKTVSDFTSGDWSRVSDSSSDKFSTSGLGLNDFTAGDWSHVSDFTDNKTSTSAAYSDLGVDNWSRINDSFNNSASSTITATDDFTTGDWTRVTDALGSQVSNKRNSLSDLTLGDWASVQDAASRTASLSPSEGEYTLSATKPTEDFVSTSPVNQWSGLNPVEGDWKQIDISEKSKNVNTPTMSEALADWAGFKQTTTSKEGLPGFALDYASSLSATGKNQLPGSFLDGDWQRVSESKPTSTLFNNPLATEDILTNQTLQTTVDLGLSQTFSRTPEDYYQAGAMFAGPVSRSKSSTLDGRVDMKQLEKELREEDKLSQKNNKVLPSDDFVDRNIKRAKTAYTAISASTQRAYAEARNGFIDLVDQPVIQDTIELIGITSQMKSDFPLTPGQQQKLNEITERNKQRIDYIDKNYIQSVKKSLDKGEAEKINKTVNAGVKEASNILEPSKKITDPIDKVVGFGKNVAGFYKGGEKDNSKDNKANSTSKKGSKTQEKSSASSKSGKSKASKNKKR